MDVTRRDLGTIAVAAVVAIAVLPTRVPVAQAEGSNDADGLLPDRAVVDANSALEYWLFRTGVESGAIRSES